MEIFRLQPSTNPAPSLELNTILNSGHHITDTTGVPLNSDRTPHASAGIDFEYAPCPYSDSPSRYPNGAPHETPVSGLEKQRLLESYSGVRKLLLAMRDSYLEKQPADYQLTALDGINILSAIQNLPKYLVNRAENPVPVDGLPQHIVVAANAASGGIGAIGAFVHGKVMELLPSGEAMLTAAEKEGSMVGDKTVCAAPSRMIIDFLDTLRDGNPKITHGDITTESGGLLTDEEVGRTIFFGVHLEQVSGLIQAVHDLDANVVPVLERHKPKKHSPREAKTALLPLELALHATIAKLGEISSVANIALGRDSETPDNFETILSANAFGLRSLKLARQKGLR